MNHPTDESRAERVNRIVTQFWQAADAGQHQDWRPLIEQHPDLSGDLRAIFEGYDRLRNFAKPFRDGDDAATPTHQPGDTIAQPRLTNQTIGDYELIEEIARGGMGVVYKARQRALNRLVAIKLILSGPSASPEDLQRFRNEAEAVAQLDHPNIVPILEVGKHGEQHFFSMKLIEGSNLAHAIRETHERRKDKDYFRWTADLLAKVALAVHYAHQRGILHRDLKPGNILLQEGARSQNPESRIQTTDKQATPGSWLLDSGFSPYVTDFGLAKRLESDANLTQSGALLGTPSYMAPEQAKGKKVGPAADIYGIGAILFEMLTGRKPFEADTPVATLLKVQTSEVERPSRLNRKVPRDLEIICMKCLEKEPRNRYTSAYELAEDLERWIAGEPIRARPLGALERVHRWISRRPAVMIGLYVALILGVSLGWNAYFWNELRKREDDLKQTQDALIRSQQQQKK